MTNYYSCESIFTWFIIDSQYERYLGKVRIILLQIQIQKGKKKEEKEVKGWEEIFMCDSVSKKRRGCELKWSSGGWTTRALASKRATGTDTQLRKLDLEASRASPVYWLFSPHVMGWASVSQNCRACTRVLLLSQIPVGSAVKQGHTSKYRSPGLCLGDRLFH
jgi:hypothetical protein